jgi:ribulose-phosphate 3-epimerase
MKLIMPAVIPASYQDLLEKLAFFDQVKVHRVQIDMIDGVFAEPASWPFTCGEDLHNHAATGTLLPHVDRVKYEIDLLCKDPEKVVADLVNLGAVRLTLHAESTDNISGLIARVRHLVGAEANFVAALISIGLSINVDTDISILLEHSDEVEYVQFMGVANIGKQGQPFDPRVVDKVRAFRAQRPNAYIQVDGGVNFDIAKELFEAGASRLVVGSALTNSTDMPAELARLEALRPTYGS